MINCLFPTGSVLEWIGSLGWSVYDTDHFICKLNAKEDKCFFKVKCKVAILFWVMGCLFFSKRLSVGFAGMLRQKPKISIYFFENNLPVLARSFDWYQWIFSPAAVCEGACKSRANLPAESPDVKVPLIFFCPCDVLAGNYTCYYICRR